MEKHYTTYPNQKEIIVHKPTYTGNYMSVGNDEWIEATKKLTYNAFKLYLYMSSNCDKYQFALSKKAVQNTIDMSDNTYTKVVKELIDNYYLVPNKGNLYDFYTVPHCEGIPHSNVVLYPTTVVERTPLEYGNASHSNGVEISNISNINNLSKNADAKNANTKNANTKNANTKNANAQKQKKKRKVEDLSVEEKNEILAHYQKRDMTYTEMYRHYNLTFGCLNKEVFDKMETDLRIAANREKEQKRNDASKNALISFGLSQSEGDELVSYLFNNDVTWNDVIDVENCINEYCDDCNMSATELLEYLRRNAYARCSTYDRNHVSYGDRRFIISNDYRWDCYEDYLISYVANPDDVKFMLQSTKKEK